MRDRTTEQLRHALVRANRRIREDRPLIPESTNVLMKSYPTWTLDTRKPVKMYQLWFRTRGCTFDRAGQCSMCNYGVGPEIDADVVAGAVEERLSQVPPGSFIYLSPSGSLLDEREVPPDLRRRLVAAVMRRAPRSFVFETRPETCTPDKVAEVRRATDGSDVICQLGVESWDAEIRTTCHLKPTPQNSYLQAIDELRRQGYWSIANVTLGGLGLSAGEAFRDSIASVIGTRDAGFSSQMVFPLSAKSGTLLGFAHDRGLWQPPSLWSLIRVLVEAERTGGDFDLHVSWFNPDVDDVVRARPDCCEKCRPVVVSALRRIQSRFDGDYLAELLQWRGCDCLRRADDQVAADDGRDYRDRLAEILDRWTNENKVPVA